nr:endonuclease/exonuclease/phosphatase family protein [uncultured Psychroserpens sp.]
MKLNLRQNFRAYLLIGYAFLLILHFLIKDNLFPLSILFYASPMPIIIAIGLILLVIFFRRKKIRILLIVVCSMLTALWLFNDYKSTKPTLSLDTTKVLFWNLAKRNSLPIETLKSQISNNKPEILAFVEAPKEILTNFEALKLELPDYNFKVLDGAMLVAAKGSITLLDFVYEDDLQKSAILEITTKQQRTKIMIVDATANLFVDKKIPLNHILDLANKYKVDCIVGDFNAPYKSAFFDAFKNNYKSFHNYNNGFTATWPNGIPLLELDHVWLSKKYKPVLLKKNYSKDSDHALLIAEYHLKK